MEVYRLEEKKAIEELKNKKADYFMISNLTSKTLLNLIEKQSKEIEEYKKQLDLDYVDKHFVPIERYNQLEKEIEELTDEYLIQRNLINAEFLNENYISKDKIKAKIEECEKEKNIPHEMDFKAFYRIKDLKNIEIKVLQSLLDKE